MGRIFVTGDLHGEIDFSKLFRRNWPEQYNLTENDYLIICGDFGLVWSAEEDKTEKYYLDILESKPYNILFVDGNHENHDRLQQMPVEHWHGGLVHKIRPNVYHLLRGQVFDIAGRKIFTMGGASSHDKETRVQGISWWPQELPSYREENEGFRNLDKHNWEVDFVFTHCCSSRIQCQINEAYKVDCLNQYFNELEDKLKFKRWYFGHYHRDFAIDEKHICVYRTILEV